MPHPMIETSVLQTPDVYQIKLNINIQDLQGIKEGFLEEWDSLSFGIWQDLMNKSINALSSKDQRQAARAFESQIPYETWNHKVKNLLEQGSFFEMTILRNKNNSIEVETKLDGRIIKPELAKKKENNNETKLNHQPVQSPVKSTLPPIVMSKNVESSKQFKNDLMQEKSLSRASTASTASTSTLSEASKDSFTPSPPVTPAPSGRFRR